MATTSKQKSKKEARKQSKKTKMKKQTEKQTKGNKQLKKESNASCSFSKGGLAVSHSRDMSFWNYKWKLDLVFYTLTKLLDDVVTKWWDDSDQRFDFLPAENVVPIWS